MDYDRIIEELKSWAGSDDRIRALVLTGSGAAGRAHPLALYRRISERATGAYGFDSSVDSWRVADEIEAILGSGDI